MQWWPHISTLKDQDYASDKQWTLLFLGFHKILAKYLRPDSAFLAKKLILRSKNFAA